MNHFYRNQIIQIKTTGKPIDLKSLPNGSLKNSEVIPIKINNERNYPMANKNEDNPSKNLPNYNFIPNPLNNFFIKDKEINLKTRPPSVSQSISQSKENSYLTSNNSKISNNASIQTYLERRHQESQQKINVLRLDKYKRETENLQYKPKMSENSKKIIDKIIKREISRDTVKMKENSQNSNNKLVRSTSHTNLNNNEANKAFTNIPLHKSVEAYKSHQQGQTYQTNNPNTLLIHRDNRSTQKLNEQDNTKRPASTGSKVRAMKDPCNTKHPSYQPANHLTVNSELLTNHDLKHYNNNIIAYPKEADREQVIEVRHKLNDYYIEQINTKLMNVDRNINDRENKINRAIYNPTMEPAAKRSINLKKNSANKLFELGKEVKNVNAPIKLQEKNNSKKFNTIQAISIKLSSEKPRDNYANAPNESDISLNKRQEDLRILKSFAENVSVNLSYENFIDRNIACNLDNANKEIITHSIYNKKNIQRNQQEIKQDMPSAFKLDNYSKEYLINKMNTLLHKENRFLKKK